ncbi:MAG: SufD family Fe-S cluster assembly protein [Anaerolineae bacterium]
MVAVRRRRAAEAPVYTRADVEALSDANNEPLWLRESRLVGWELYEETPMPHEEEEWRRSDYRSIQWEEASPLIHANGVSREIVPKQMLEPLIGEEQGGTLVFVDGKVVQSELSPALAQQGVVFTDLLTACREHEELVRTRLMTRAVKPGDGKFAALHAALWTHGVFLYVPDRKVVDLPLHVVMYNTKPGATMGHVLVALGEAAQATLLVDYQSANTEHQAAYIGATELLVGQSANLRYVGLQDWNRKTYEFNHQRASVESDGVLDWVLGTMGGKFAKNFIEVDLDGKGASTRVSGMFFADENQFFDLDTQQNHNGPLTVSDLLFKGAAKHRARTLWQGHDQVAAEHAEDRRLPGVPQSGAGRGRPHGCHPRSGNRSRRRALHPRRDLRHARRAARFLPDEPGHPAARSPN